MQKRVFVSQVEFRKIVSEISEIAVKNALIDAGVTSPIIWRTKAIEEYGEKLIKRLEKCKLIERKQHYPKGNYFFDVKELNYALSTEQRHIFYIHEEYEEASS